MKDDTYTEAEVVERPFLVTCGSGRAWYSAGTKVGEVKPQWIVIDLENADVDARSDANIESASNRVCSKYPANSVAAECHKRARHGTFPGARRTSQGPARSKEFPVDPRRRS